MKKSIFIIFLLPLSLTAGVCPELSGTYHCAFSDNRYSPLKIEQRSLSESGEELVSYKFIYTNFSTEGEEFMANPTGIPDGQGWITKCYRNTLRSIPTDASMMAKIFVDDKQVFIRKLNGFVVQKCPKKTSTKNN